MRCPVCGVSRDAFADEAAWFAHAAIHPREVPDDPWQQARIIATTSWQGKRIMRERDRLARERRRAKRRDYSREYQRRLRHETPWIKASCDARYYARHHAKVLAARRERHARNREEENLRNRVWQLDNHEQYRATARDWEQRNRDKRNAQKNERRRWRWANEPGYRERDLAQQAARKAAKLRQQEAS